MSSETTTVYHSPSWVIGNDVTSLLSSLPSATPGMTGLLTPGTATKKPYAEFLEVKAAIFIDRIYVPLIVSVGVVGNALCFLTLVFSSLRTTSTCVYMAAIAVLDCVILVVVLGFLLGGVLGHTTFYLGQDWTCGLHYFLFYFAIHLDVLLLVAMTVDRYVIVRFPLRAQRLCTPRSALKAMVGLGAVSFALNVQVLFTRRLTPTRSAMGPLWCWYPDPSVKFFMLKVYTWIDASIYSFLPFLSLLSLNLLIIRQLRLSLRFSQQFRDGKASSKVSAMTVVTRGDSGHGSLKTSNTDTKTEVPKIGSATSGKTKDGGVEDGGSGSTRKTTTPSTNITSMLLLVSFTFLALTSPIVIMLLYKRYSWLPKTNAERARARLVHAFLDNLMYTNHAVNFLLYCLSGRRFRQELWRLGRRVCGRR